MCAEQFRNEIELERDADEILCQCVMYLSGDPISLREYRLKALMESSHAALIKQRAKYEQSATNGKKEPPSVVVGWQDVELELRSLDIPDAIVVRSLNSERISAGRQICVGSIAPVGWRAPVGIEAVELRSVKNFGRDHITEARVFEGVTCVSARE